MNERKEDIELVGEGRNKCLSWREEK